MLPGYAEALFSAKGDTKVLDHCQMAKNCLANKIDDALYHLMLIITLASYNNRMLQELGSKSQQDSPRNSDLTLRLQEELLETLRDSRTALKRPNNFHRHTAALPSIGYHRHQYRWPIFLIAIQLATEADLE
ncbi:hypothetical protein CORC01_09848 [Colletotrichum orchidophilum]|uniref:Uncharacterized protein n=1 Tax=Colletotrichum orchidophilum TaxID=1209926 RepID=A0A1G4B079_9PEZI|nr:uncharacterized protein CORC01_09848 [Colletotrichum orchidophilum]OHE94830.1 hypothetical protein CORC01_09848 [Colletotrichum orchidophilum]